MTHPCHTASKWWRWYSNPGSLVPEPLGLRVSRLNVTFTRSPSGTSPQSSTYLFFCPHHHTFVIALTPMIGIPGLQASSPPWLDISPRISAPDASRALGECPMEREHGLKLLVTSSARIQRGGPNRRSSSSMLSSCYFFSFHLQQSLTILSVFVYLIKKNLSFCQK